MLFSQLETCPISQLQFQVNIKYVNSYMNNSYNPQCDCLEILPTISQSLIGLGKFYLIYSHFILNSWFAMATRSLNKIAITGSGNWKLKTKTGPSKGCRMDGSWGATKQPLKVQSPPQKEGVGWWKSKSRDSSILSFDPAPTLTPRAKQMVIDHHCSLIIP